ncbi:MAG: TRAP transporter small permease [Sphaerochaetaceae bacterium]|nr:TRAP transporter small permease [Sphaerochaetaceae bacterium]
MNRTQRILQYLDKFSDYFLMTILGVMGVVLFAQVFFRYVLGAPLIWGEELARYLHVWIALMGIRFGLKYKAHLNISFVYDRMSARVQQIIDIVVDSFLILCILIYFPGAWNFFINQATILSPAMEINMGLVHAPVLLGFIGALIYMVNNLIRNIMNLRQKASGTLSQGGGN